MNNMNLLPEDLRPQRGCRGRRSPAFGLLIGAALLVAAGYAYLTVEITRLEARIETGRTRVEALAASNEPPAAVSDAAGTGSEQRLVREVVDRLDQCVPPEVALTGLRFFNDAEVPAAGQPSMLAPVPEMVEITGVSATGQAIGDFLTALGYSGPYADVELSSLSRREDGEFAFTVLGRLSL